MVVIDLLSNIMDELTSSAEWASLP